MNKVLGVGIVMFVAVIALGFFMWRNLYIAPTQRVVSPETNIPALIPIIEERLAAKMAVASELTTLPSVRTALLAANTENAALKYNDILVLDRAWRSDPNYPTATALTQNAAADALREFQAKCPELSEIFVTDRFGLNVAQTNKTSDYYQADEDWWTAAYAGGKGKAYHGNIEFDQSSQKEAIALYFPVLDEQGAVLGVVKAVLDLDYLKRPE